MNRIIKRIKEFLDGLEELGWEPLSRPPKDWDMILGSMDQYETEEHVISCEQCNISYLIFAFLQRGFSDYERVTCEKCGRPLGKIRADISYEIIASKPL
ncbi:MAG: hypothetical protein ACTSQI_13860 [Candidatus Helarchaeota archaeon]